MAGQTGIAGLYKVGRMLCLAGRLALPAILKYQMELKSVTQSGNSRRCEERKFNSVRLSCIRFIRIFQSSVIFKKLPELMEKINNLERCGISLKKQ